LPSEQLAIGFTGLMPGNARQTISSLSVASQQGNLLSVEAVLGRLHMPKHYATWHHTHQDPNSFRPVLCGFLVTCGLGERAHSRTHPFYISTYRAKKGQWVVGDTQSARGIVR